MRRKLNWQGTLFLSTFGLIVSETLLAQSLPEVVRDVLVRHPAVNSAVQEVRSRGYEVSEAESSYLPTVSINAGVGYESVNNPLREADSEFYGAGVALKQVVFDGFATSSEVSRQDARLSSAKFEALAALENEALTASRAYLDVLRYQELVELSLAARIRHQEIQSQMEERFASGLASQADRSQVAARLALVDANLNSAQANFQDAQTAFLRSVGYRPRLNQMSFPQQIVALQPGTMTMQLEDALRNNPVLEAATADVRAAQSQFTAAKSERYPVVNLEAGFNRYEDVGGLQGTDEDAYVALRFEYTLYDGNRRSSRSQYASHQLDKAKAIRDDTHLQVMESVRLAVNAQLSLQQSVEIQETYVEMARLTRDSYDDQYSIGNRSLIDLLNAESELVNAQRGLINSVADLRYAGFRVLNARGVLIQSLGVTVDDFAPLAELREAN